MTKKRSEKKSKFKVHKRLNLLHPAPDVSLEELEGEWNTKYVRDLSKKELDKIIEKISRKRRKPAW